MAVNNPTKHLQLLRGTTSKNAEYTGVAGEVVYDTETHHLNVHDGVTQGGHKVALVKDVQDGLSDKLGKNRNAVSATKATQDGDGNVIKDTYATKSELGEAVKITSGTTDLEAGVSPLATGTLYFMYE